MATITSLIKRLNLMEQEIKLLKTENKKLKDQTKDYNELKKYIEKIKEPYIEEFYLNKLCYMLHCKEGYNYYYWLPISHKKIVFDNFYNMNKRIKSIYDYFYDIDVNNIERYDKKNNYNYKNGLFDIFNINWELTKNESQNNKNAINKIVLFDIFNNIKTHNLIKYKIILRVKEFAELIPNQSNTFCNSYNYLNIPQEFIDYIKDDKDFVIIFKELQENKYYHYSKYNDKIIKIIIEKFKNDFKYIENKTNSSHTITINFESNIKLKKELKININKLCLSQYNEIKIFVSTFLKHFITNKIKLEFINLYFNKYIKERDIKLDKIRYKRENDIELIKLKDNLIDESKKTIIEENIINGKKVKKVTYTEKYNEITKKQQEIVTKYSKQQTEINNYYIPLIQKYKQMETLIDINFNSYQEYIETDWIDYDESHQESIFPITFYNYCILDYIKLELYYQS
jgi:hypothetical protein